jgi:hypothetical protein
MAIRDSSGTHFPARLRFRLPNAVAAVVNVSTGESTPWNLRRILASKHSQLSERKLSRRIEELSKSVRKAVEDKLALDSAHATPLPFLSQRRFNEFAPGLRSQWI